MCFILFGILNTNIQQLSSSTNDFVTASDSVDDEYALFTKTFVPFLIIIVLIDL